ncbi:MAG TPA: energy transducer TonB [Thermoanaerobaculia bacterium]|jgi:protein TonB|nr:energy transducer TonB [Thermoanaerobaculia bacterium]
MFEHSLIDLEAKPSTRRRWLSLPIAVGLHVAGLTAFAFASYWNVGSVLEPQLSEVFFVSMPPPPPPAGGGGGSKQPVKVETKKQAPAPATRELVQPTAKDVPEKPPTPAVNDSIQDLTPGPASSGPTSVIPGDGDCPGCPPGIGHGPGPVGPAENPGGTMDNSPIQFSFGMTKPEVIHQVQPRYSEQARRAGVQGMVIVEAVIDEQGNVTHVRLVHGLPMALDQAAMQAVQQWRFKPALLNGHPVKVFYTLTVNFTIQR